MPDRASADVERAAVRTAVVWDTVRAALERLQDRGDAAVEPLDVVDLGGGTGGLAVPVARLGHRVTVVDPSPDALASLRRRAVESGVEDRVVGVQGDAADLGEQVGPHTAHLVLCHGVIEVVDDPDAALAAIHDALRPGGLVSVVVAGRQSAVLARALAGDLARARELLAMSVEDWDLRRDGPRRYAHDEVTAMLATQRFVVERVEAVRVFSDLVPGALVDAEPRARHELLELERAAAGRTDFMAVAGQLHLLARR